METPDHEIRAADNTMGVTWVPFLYIYLKDKMYVMWGGYISSQNLIQIYIYKIQMIVSISSPTPSRQLLLKSIVFIFPFSNLRSIKKKLCNV